MSDIDYEIDQQMAPPSAVPQKIPLEPANFPHLSHVEWEALTRMASSVGASVVKTLLRQGTPDAHRLAAHEFMAAELTQARASAHATPAPQQAPRSQTIKLEVSSYSGDERIPLRRWFCELDLAIQARQISDASMQVAFAMSKMTGRARSWAYGCRLADTMCFPNLEALKADMRSTFEPPETDFRIRRQFLTVKQGNMDMHDYIQHVRYLASCISGVPIDMPTQVSTFMDGLREGPARTQLYREYPTTLEAAFAIALREEYNARQARSNARARAAPVHVGPEPMDLSHAEVRRSPRDQAPRSAQRTCFRCRKPGHIARDCRVPATGAAGTRGRAGHDVRPARSPSKNERDQ